MLIPGFAIPIFPAFAFPVLGDARGRCRDQHKARAGASCRTGLPMTVARCHGLIRAPPFSPLDFQSPPTHERQRRVAGGGGWRGDAEDRGGGHCFENASGGASGACVTRGAISSVPLAQARHVSPQIIEGSGRFADVIAYAWRLLHDTSSVGASYSFRDLKARFLPLLDAARRGVCSRSSASVHCVSCLSPVS